MTPKIIHAPFVEQMPELPRGCEVTSLSLLLQHAGIHVDKMTLSREVKKVPFKEGDCFGHLNDGFVGDMYSFETDGLGVYHSPIKKLAERYLPNKIVDITGSETEKIYHTIDQGLPVWIVTNDTFKELGEEHFKTWNTRLGELRITYRMHSVLVVGYDDDHVYINDPLYHEPNRAIDRHDFEKAWEQMGRQAITYIK
ncbi:C39 family peptidase [Bacillus dakarensis]|uniref:C39 family peptidase n=1 Tax=Robertmurraya dakarensis TaxID=1926278 RepID=UPI0009817AF5|nr:C39 family peptidase [Bacillus dakarensis]